MSVFERIREHKDRRDGLIPPADAAVAPPEQDAELTRRRERLADDVAETQYDLGGLVYEMAIRDHFRLDVLMRRSAVLQELDAELAEVERLLRLREGGASGTCDACGALHSRGAVFCWQCGGRLLEAVAG